MEGKVDPLLEKVSRIKEVIFDPGVKIQRMNTQANLSSPSDDMGIRLPKISVPTSNGNIMKWNMFWQQFQISVYRKTKLKYI